MLTPETRERVKTEYAKMTRETADQIAEFAKKHGVSLPRDLETALSDCGDAFQLLRYIYERPKGTTFYITHLPLVLRNVITQITDWGKLGY
jgi:hypothetical protein